MVATSRMLILHFLSGMILFNMHACAAIAQESASEKSSEKIEIVQSDVTNISNSIYSGDIDTILKYTHPKIVSLLGGERTARKQLQKVVDQLKKINMQVDFFEFPEDPKFFETSIHEFAIVPTFTIMIANGKKIESLNFQLGVRELDSPNWTYIEESRITNQNIKQFFPDFPSNYDFPKFYRKLVE